MIDINRFVEMFNNYVNNKNNYKYYVLVLLGVSICIMIYSYNKKMNNSLKELENKMNNKFEIILYDNIEKIKSTMDEENSKIMKLIDNKQELTENIDNNDENIIDSYSNDEVLVVNSSITHSETDKNQNFFKIDEISINDTIHRQDTEHNTEHNTEQNTEHNTEHNTEQSNISYNKLMQYKLDQLRNMAEQVNIELEINNKRKTKKQLANDIIQYHTK